MAGGLEIADDRAFGDWLKQQLRSLPLGDDDDDYFDYVMTLVKNQSKSSEDAMRSHCVSQLVDFYGKETEPLVDSIIDALKSQSYLTDSSDTKGSSASRTAQQKFQQQSYQEDVNYALDDGSNGRDLDEDREEPSNDRGDNDRRETSALEEEEQEEAGESYYDHDEVDFNEAESPPSPSSRRQSMREFDDEDRDFRRKRGGDSDDEEYAVKRSKVEEQVLGSEDKTQDMNNRLPVRQQSRGPLHPRGPGMGRGGPRGFPRGMGPMMRPGVEGYNPEQPFAQGLLGQPWMNPMMMQQQQQHQMAAMAMMRGGPGMGGMMQGGPPMRPGMTGVPMMGRGMPQQQQHLQGHMTSMAAPMYTSAPAMMGAGGPMQPMMTQAGPRPGLMGHVGPQVSASQPSHMPSLLGPRPAIQHQQGPKPGRPGSQYKPQRSRSLAIQNIPPEHNNETNLHRHFEQYGQVLAIKPETDVKGMPSPKSAIVTFSDPRSATAAFQSEQPVLGNRFIRLAWTQDPHPLPQGQHQAQHMQQRQARQQTALTQSAIAQQSDVQHLGQQPGQFRGASASQGGGQPSKPSGGVIQQQVKRPSKAEEQAKLRASLKNQQAMIEKHLSSQVALLEMINKEKDLDEKTRTELLEQVSQLSKMTESAQKAMREDAAKLAAMEGKGRGAHSSGASRGTAARGRGTSRGRGRGRGRGDPAVAAMARAAKRTTVLKISGFSKQDESFLLPHFSAFGGCKDVTVRGDHALVTYNTRHSAEKAMRSGLLLDKKQLTAEWYVPESLKAAAAKSLAEAAGADEDTDKDGDKAGVPAQDDASQESQQSQAQEQSRQQQTDSQTAASGADAADGSDGADAADEPASAADTAPPTDPTSPTDAAPTSTSQADTKPTSASTEQNKPAVDQAEQPPTTSDNTSAADAEPTSSAAGAVNEATQQEGAEGQ